MKVQIGLAILASIPGLYAYGGYSFDQDSYDFIFGGQKDYKVGHRLESRASGATTCDNSLGSKVFTRFTGIFFGDFTTRNGQDILGPLAVKGTLTGEVYTINANGAVDCSDLEHSFDGYGLVVGGSLNSTTDRVHGAIFLPAGTDTSHIQALNANCPIVTDRGTGLFDFNTAYANAVSASLKLSLMTPTLKLNNNGVLSRLGPKVGDFDVMTVNTCENSNCKIFPGMLSYPNQMLNGVGNWNGAQGMSFPQQLVINIPVPVGSTFKLAGNQPSLGITVCSTIYNFYPSDENGLYTPGRIYIERDTGGQLGGLTLAPEANVEESGTGNFAGLIVANDYTWREGTGGVEIHDYAALGGTCSGFTGCFPILNDTIPRYPELFVIPPVTATSSDETITEIVTTITMTTPSKTMTYSTVTGVSSDTTMTYSTITTELSDTRTFSTMTASPPVITSTYDLLVIPSDTHVYSTINDLSSDSTAYSTISDVSSDTHVYSTINDLSSDSTAYSTISDVSSDTTAYSTINDVSSNTEIHNPINDVSSDATTYSTITDVSSEITTYSTIIVTSSDTTTYSTINDVSSDTTAHSTITDVSSDTTAHSTITDASSDTTAHSTITDVSSDTTTDSTISGGSVSRPQQSSSAETIETSTETSSSNTITSASLDFDTSLIESISSHTTSHFEIIPTTHEYYPNKYKWHDKYKKNKHYKHKKFNKGHEHSGKKGWNKEDHDEYDEDYEKHSEEDYDKYSEDDYDEYSEDYHDKYSEDYHDKYSEEDCEEDYDKYNKED